METIIQVDININVLIEFHEYKHARYDENSWWIFFHLAHFSHVTLHTYHF